MKDRENESACRYELGQICVAAGAGHVVPPGIEV